MRAGLVPVVGGDLPLPDYNIAGGGFVADDALDRIFEQSVVLGAKNFVVPGSKPAKLARHAEALRAHMAKPNLFVPGIGALGGTMRDVVATTRGCRVYAVVGRAIYGAADPGEAARRLAGEALARA
jgi:orotidine-5'-phosphate decarboxylase